MSERQVPSLSVCPDCGGERDVWQHDETGRICATAARPGPRWFSAPCPSCSEPAAPAPSEPEGWARRLHDAVVEIAETYKGAPCWCPGEPDDTHGDRHWPVCDRIRADLPRLLAAERGKGE